jgi:hypothetical protein
MEQVASQIQDLMDLLTEEEDAMGKTVSEK